MLESFEIRARSREYLNGRWNACAVILLVYYVLMIGVGAIPVAGSIAGILVGGPLTWSMSYIFLKITRGEEVSVEMVFKGFEDFGRSFVASLLIAIYTLLWTLLLIVPGIIAALSYSMTYFILCENPGISAMDAISQSKQMMFGHKTELFMLSLSFIGWFLLGMLSFGIAYLWIGSYYYTAFAVFYQEVKGGGQVTA